MVGSHVAYFTDDIRQDAQKEMLRAMNTEVCVMPLDGDKYGAVYEAVTEDIRKRIQRADAAARQAVPEDPVAHS